MDNHYPQVAQQASLVNFTIETSSLRIVNKHEVAIYLPNSKYVIPKIEIAPWTEFQLVQKNVAVSDK